ncbi:TM129 ligase, partial [Polypterus senegalus]
MESPEVTFTLAYVVFAVCFVFPPNEFRSAGVTVQNLLSGWLGSEDVAFVHYHIKRTCATLLVHSLLPLGYYVGMCFASPEQKLYYVHLASDGWQLYFSLAFALPLVCVILVYYWSLRKWSCHPIARTLASHALPQSGWRAVASSVNTEFRRIDKFATGAPGARVIVTDTWVIKVTTYNVHIAQQQEIHLTVTDSKQHELSPDFNTPVQFLTICVASINPYIKPFDIRLNSTEYGEMREKLHAPIRNAANVVIHQTLSDMFLETFKCQVELNQHYSLPSGQVIPPAISDTAPPPAKTCRVERHIPREQLTPKVGPTAHPGSGPATQTETRAETLPGYHHLVSCHVLHRQRSHLLPAPQDLPFRHPLRGFRDPLVGATHTSVASASCDSAPSPAKSLLAKRSIPQGQVPNKAGPTACPGSDPVTPTEKGAETLPGHHHLAFLCAAHWQRSPL